MPEAGEVQREPSPGSQQPEASFRGTQEPEQLGREQETRKEEQTTEPDPGAFPPDPEWGRGEGQESAGDPCHHRDHAERS